MSVPVDLRKPDQPIDLRHMAVPAVAVMANDHIVEIRTDGEPPLAVDWLVHHRADHFCPDHGAKELCIDYSTGDNVEGHHWFEDPAVWLKLLRPGVSAGEAA